MGVFYAGAIGLVSVVAAGARGAWLAIMALFFLYMIVGLLKKKLALLVIPVLVVGATAMWVLQDNVGNERFSGTIAGIGKFIETGVITDHSLDLRIQTWRAAIEVIKEHPVLGVGSGTLEETFSGAVFKDKLLSTFNHIHNDILQAWSALGILGLISILALIAIPIWAGVSHQSPATPYIIIIAVVFGINGLTDVPFLKTYSLKYYMMVVGLLLIIHQKNLIRSD
jgi:O-antigen ligase